MRYQVLWEILTEDIPYAGQSEMAVVYAIMENERPQIPSDTDALYSKLIQDCWDPDPNNRTFHLSTLQESPV